MNPQRNKEVILDYLEAFRTSPVDREKIDSFISNQDMELKRHVEVFQAAMPGYVLEPRDIIAEGDKVVVRFTFHGRHLGELMGHPPTGRELSFSGIIIYEVENDQIVNHWMEFDVPTFMKQLKDAAPVQEVAA